MGSGTLRDVQRGRATNQRKRRRDQAARRIAIPTRPSTGSGADRRQSSSAPDPPQQNPNDDRRASRPIDNPEDLRVQVDNKKRRVGRGGPPAASTSLSSTVMETPSAARLPPGPANLPPVAQGRRERDISPIRVPTATTTTNDRGGRPAAASIMPPPPLPADGGHNRQGEKRANRKRNRRPRSGVRDASASSRPSTPAASAPPSSRRLPQSPEDLLTPYMLKVAIRLPNRPRSSEIQEVVDVLPAEFYPDSSPLDRAIYAADHAEDRARLGKKLAEQQKFRLKVVSEQERQENDMRVKIMAEMLSEAQKKADRERADPFYQSDGQRPSTSGTQRRSASSSSSRPAAPSRSGPPPPRSSRRDDDRSFRGGKGGRAKGRK